MKKYILKVINDLPSDGVKAADVNADGQINSIDFTWLKKYMLKAVEKFPGEASNNPDAVIQFESGFAHSVLLKKDGTVWVLGNNGKGQLGLPEVSAVNEPVMINGLSGINRWLREGSIHWHCRKTVLWAWGNNYSLQLIEYMERDPDTKERFTSIPIKVETHSDIKYVAAKFSRTS